LTVFFARRQDAPRGEDGLATGAGDAAGRVEAVGTNVRRLRPGDEVLGFCPGTFVEYARAEADQGGAQAVSLTFEQAAVVPIAGGGGPAGDPGCGCDAGRVLGACQRGGTCAVQIAATLGAEVTGVCCTCNAGLVRSIGGARTSSTTRRRTSPTGARFTT
jgi:hypothetical protein